MRNRNIIFLLLIIIFFSLSEIAAQSGAKEDEKLLQEAKLLIFDKNWIEAEKKLDELLERYPKSPSYSTALFYKGKCLSEQKGREREAWKAFEEFLKRPDRPSALVEEAEISSVDLAFNFLNSGDQSFIPVLESRLTNPSKIIRYYTALKMSYLQDKNLAQKAVPVLKGLIESEKDQELIDRAKIALLRISPASLKEIQEKQEGGSFRLVKIRVYEKGKKTVSVSINLPLSLADLAIQAMPEKDKAALKQKGYDLNRILNDLAKSKEKMVRIEEEGNIVEIWIE
ncbi:MAG: tetratricopeptide repeat protein [Candidatus Saccharicenans sp.]|nr:MAG: hypothetical protein C0168_07610 [Candidatus Aminicenantes bacterium]HEK84742.1 tetratricopeptide repeat protein [Candidatus Aminicenantes bacterium]